MPNLFSKITSQDGTIRLFSGGIQHKSLVSVFDVVRCLKFMAESDNISREIFHCSNENMTVKEVAEVCKEINPNMKLIETDFYALSDVTITDAMKKYRSDLRDLPAQYDNSSVLGDITWPSRP